VERRHLLLCSKQGGEDPEQKAQTGSVALLYLSAWKSEDAAKTFASIYADELSRKYTGVKRQPDSESTGEQIYQTNEGPVLIALNGNQVFTSESFDLTTAHKLELLMLGAQANENQQTARAMPVSGELSSGMVRWMAESGLMKAAIRH
jgi:hypothetical protein